jgi:hypothetical protein
MLHRIRCECQVVWRPLIQRAVRTMALVVRQVLGQDLLEMTASEYEEPVQTLSTDGDQRNVRRRHSPGGLEPES